MKTSQKWLAAAIAALSVAGLFSVWLSADQPWAAFGVVMSLGLAVWFLGEVWRYEDKDD
jgi:hypothetical protein